jgi:RNA polymerase sigma-70 factor (ECF subfamily)
LKIYSEDIVTIERLKKGEIKAFDDVYEKYARRIYVFALKYLKNKDEAEELVQSTFLKVWEKRKTLKSDTSFKSYIFTITFNEICNLFRRRKSFATFYHEEITQSSDISYETEEQIDFGSTLKQLDIIVRKLPEKQQMVFIKSRIEGKTSKEIASETGLSVGTIDNYISDSVRFIRKNLTDIRATTILIPILSAIFNV